MLVSGQNASQEYERIKRCAPIGVGPSRAITFGGAPTTPKTIFPATILAWHRSDQGTNTIVDGAAITAYNEISGSGDANRNYTQAVANNQPSYKANWTNGKPAIRMAFTAGHFQFMKTGVWSVTTAMPWAVFFIGSLDLGTISISNQRMFSDNTPTFQCAQLTGTAKASILDGGATHEVDSTTNVAGSVPFAICSVFNGATSSLYLSALTPATGNIGVSPSLGGTAVFMGDYGAAPDTFFGIQAGYIAEDWWVSGVPTAGQIAASFSYISSRYAIAIGP